jgi:hypothetical protein
VMQHDADFTIRFPHECPGLVDDGQLAAAVVRSTLPMLIANSPWSWIT